MTALSGPIVFNNSTGSDTAASGCGPATAVTTSAIFSSGSAGITVSSSTGMSVGDLIYVPSNTGRKFNVIASISGTSITCDDNWDDSQNGVSIYVGGKRATFDNADSRRLFDQDGAAGFVMETETDQSLTSTLLLRINNSVDNYGVLRGSSTANTKPVLTFSMNGIGIDVSYQRNYWKISNLALRNTSSTKTSATGVRTNSAGTIFDDLEINDSTNNCNYGIHLFNVSQATARIRNCHISHTVNDGVLQNTNNDMLHMSNTVINNCGGHGANLGHIYLKTTRIENCIFHNNASDGIYIAERDGNQYTYSINDCIFYNNGGDGLSYRQHNFIYIQRNIFVNNGAYGIGNSWGENQSPSEVCDRNAFYNNASGQAEDSPLMTNPITLQANPFVDPTASPPDFNLNNALGGGSVLRSTKYTLGG